MNINRKYIIIFGTVVLSVVIIAGAITYYNQRTEQDQIPDGEQSILNSSLDNPDRAKALSDFINECKNAVLFSDIEGLKNKEIKEIVCMLKQERGIFVLKDRVALVSDFMPSFLSLDSITSFRSGDYIGISVDLRDVVRKYDASLLEKKKLYFCDISEPSLTDPLILQLGSKHDLFFDEGSVSCSGIEMDKTPAMVFLGFVPQAESLRIKEYLVDEQTISEVLSKESFFEMKDILNNYPIIWQMGKPIIL
jgi:hypothetical protein